MSTPVALRELDRSLDEDQPPPEGLYVAPSRAIVDRVVAVDGRQRTGGTGGQPAAGRAILGDAPRVDEAQCPVGGHASALTWLWPACRTV